MTLEHDFKRFPELQNNELADHYFESPFKQITEDFRAKIINVHDGDTMTVRWEERDFDFPVRFETLAAPELNEDGGKESQQWLESKILNEIIDFKLSKQRVGKWNRIIADPIFKGLNMSELSMLAGHGIPFSELGNNPLPDFKKELKKWAFQ